MSTAILLQTNALRGMPPDTLKVIQLSDTHICNLTGYHPAFVRARAHYGDGARALAVFLSTAPVRRDADIVVITGDLIDYFEAETAAGDWLATQVEQFAPLYFECPVTLHLVLGNHDIASYWIEEPDEKESFQINVNRARAAWIRNIPSFRYGTYYSRDYAVGETSYRFLFLDNGYSLKDGSVLDPHQLDWLAHELENAAENPVVIFMHKYLRVPDLDGDGRYFAASNTVTIDSIRCSTGFYRLLNEYQNIKLLLVGHGHKNITETIYFPSGNRVVQTETAAFAADPANWRMINFAKDAIQISPCGADREKTVIKIRNE